MLGKVTTGADVQTATLYKMENGFAELISAKANHNNSFAFKQATTKDGEVFYKEHGSYGSIHAKFKSLISGGHIESMFIGMDYEQFQKNVITKAKYLFTHAGKEELFNTLVIDLGAAPIIVDGQPVVCSDITQIREFVTNTYPNGSPMIMFTREEQAEVDSGKINAKGDPITYRMKQLYTIDSNKLTTFIDSLSKLIEDNLTDEVYRLEISDKGNATFLASK